MLGCLDFIYTVRDAWIVFLFGWMGSLFVVGCLNAWMLGCLDAWMLGCVGFIYTLGIVARILSDGVNRDRLYGTNAL